VSAFVTTKSEKAPASRLLKKTQRQGARQTDERRRTYAVRWSEAVECNEAYEAFSAACYEP
jgi:hypothetical protein